MTRIEIQYIYARNKNRRAQGTPKGALSCQALIMVPYVRIGGRKIPKTDLPQDILRELKRHISLIRMFDQVIIIPECSKIETVTRPFSSF